VREGLFIKKSISRCYTPKHENWDEYCFLERERKGNFDVIGLQETKAQPEQIQDICEESFPDHPFQYFNSAEKKGYSSTALFSKIEPLSVSHEIDGLPCALNEGRVITAEFETCFVVVVYTPNSKPDLARLDYRYNEWDIKFREYLLSLEKKKPVIACGDLNVAHREIDLKNPAANKTTKTKPGNPGFTDKERERFENYLENGFIDTFRFLYPDLEDRYSWWSYRFGARARNAGWRIDYVLVSKMLENNIQGALIHDDVHGSDHCPVSLKLTL